VPSRLITTVPYFGAWVTVKLTGSPSGSTAFRSPVTSLTDPSPSRVRLFLSGL
jgi:hypothetical protein